MNVNGRNGDRIKVEKVKDEIVITVDNEKTGSRMIALDERTAEIVMNLIYGLFVREHVGERLEKEGFSFSPKDADNVSEKVLEEIRGYDDYFDLEDRCISYIASELLDLSCKETVPEDA